MAVVMGIFVLFLTLMGLHLSLTLVSIIADILYPVKKISCYF